MIPDLPTKEEFLEVCSRVYPGYRTIDTCEWGALSPEELYENLKYYHSNIPNVNRLKTVAKQLLQFGFKP